MRVSLSVRLTDVGYTRLGEVAAEHGITNRALFEAFVMSFFHVEQRRQAGELPPAEATAVEAVWATAARIDHDARSARRGELRHRVPIEMDADLATFMKTICNERNVTMNSFLATAVTPWGSGWGGPDEVSARERQWSWAVDRARVLDLERRRRK